MEPVELRTGDLLLRAWRPQDAEAVYRACLDPVLQHWTPGLPWPVTREFADDVVRRLGTSEDRRTAYAVVGAADGTLLGSVDLTKPSASAVDAELGYWSTPWSRGRRVTERASRVLLRRAFASCGLRRVDWRATVGNHASRLTALRLGFRMIGTMPDAATLGDGTRTERWMAAMLPGDLSDRELPDAVRRQGRVFGGAPPSLRAGPVTLRPSRPRDRDAVVAAYRDPEVIRWYGVPSAYTPQRAERLITVEIPLEWARGTQAVFAVTGPGDEWVGTVDLRVSPGDPQAGEVGFLTAPHARGHGYATAALRALAAWGFTELGLVRLQWRAEVGNDASRRVAEKAGFTMEGVLRQSRAEDGRRYDCWVGSLLSEERAG